MIPNAAAYNPDPAYLRELVKLIGISQERCAAALGISPRQLRYYLSHADDHQDAPYCVQFALESLAAGDRGRDAHLELIRAMALVVKAAGGQVRVRRALLEELPDDREHLERYDDPATGDLLFTVHRPPERRQRLT